MSTPERKIVRPGLKGPGDQYPRFKITPEVASKLVESYAEQVWNDAECRAFSVKMIEVMTKALELWRA